MNQNDLKRERDFYWSFWLICWTVITLVFLASVFITDGRNANNLVLAVFGGGAVGLAIVRLWVIRLFRRSPLGGRLYAYIKSR